MRADELVQQFRFSRRELTRLEAISKSPIHSTFGEVLDGLTSLRVLGLRNRETAIMMDLLESANRPRYYRCVRLCCSRLVPPWLLSFVSLYSPGLLHVPSSTCTLLVSPFRTQRLHHILVWVESPVCVGCALCMRRCHGHICCKHAQLSDVGLVAPSSRGSCPVRASTV